MSVFDSVNVNRTEEIRNSNSTIFKCCSGFCVDLLRKFSNDLSFDFALKRVKDGAWGGIVNGSWNGLVAELINHETDLVMTSLKINSARYENSFTHSKNREKYSIEKEGIQSYKVEFLS